MTSQDIKAFIADQFGLDELQDDTPIFSQGLLDSFSMIELISHLEAQAGIKVGVMEVTLDNLDSIEKILRFVESKKSAA